MSKSNKTMRLAIMLLVLTLITSCFVGGTFAKYVTKGEGKDTARVAKWGVTVTGNEAGMFKEKYTGDTAGLGEKNTVVAGDEVLAPGTKGTFEDTFSISGTPEVAVEVALTADVSLEGWKLGGYDYCPVIFTVDGEDYYVGKAGINSVTDLETAVEEAIKNSKNSKSYYKAGTDLATGRNAGNELNGPDFVHKTADIKWRWDFESDSSLDGNRQDDEGDTKLGNLTGEDVPKITVTTYCTVTQVD